MKRTFIGPNLFDHASNSEMFTASLAVLILKYGVSKDDVFLAVDKLLPSSPKAKSRKRHLVKVYKHPQTGEIVKTRSVRNKRLAAWKAEFPNEKIAQWVVDVEPSENS